MANQWERIQRQFLWGDSESKEKNHFLKWISVTKDKKWWGLGMKKLIVMSAARSCTWGLKVRDRKTGFMVQSYLR